MELAEIISLLQENNNDGHFTRTLNLIEQGNLEAAAVQLDILQQTITLMEFSGGITTYSSANDVPGKPIKWLATELRRIDAENHGNQ